MPKMKDSEQKEHEQRQEFHDKIIRNVHKQLGIPPNHTRTNVTSIDGYRYRINVLVTDHAQLETAAIPCTSIKHSFFLSCNEDGVPIHSDPPITKLYGK